MAPPERDVHRRATGLQTMSIFDDAERFGELVSPRTFVSLAVVTSLVLRRRPGAERIVLATLLSALASRLCKDLLPRRRPRWFTKDNRKSFPSGHGAVSTAYLFSTALTVSPRHRPVALALAAMGVATVDAARVVAHAHWPSDVLAGDVLGLLGVAAATVRR